MNNGYKEHIRYAIRRGVDMNVIFALAIEVNSAIILKMLIDDYHFDFLLEDLLTIIIKGKYELADIMIFKLLQKDALLIHYSTIIRFFIYMVEPEYTTIVFGDYRMQEENQCLIKPQECIREMMKILMKSLPYVREASYVYNLLDFILTYDLILPYFENEREMTLFLLNIATYYRHDDVIDFLIHYNKLRSHLTDNDLRMAEEDMEFINDARMHAENM